MEFCHDINDYGIIGDCRSAALVSNNGSMDWLCWPKFDSPSFFAAILDPEKGGRWKIAPTGSWQARQKYREKTNILQTLFSKTGAAVRLTDFMPALTLEQKNSTFLPAHQIIRLVECLCGEAAIECVFDPRPGYGTQTLTLQDKKFMGLRAETRFGLLALQTNAALSVANGKASGNFSLKKGQKAWFSLSLSDEYPASLSPYKDAWFEQLLRRTETWWQDWSSKISYRGEFESAVLRSALVLKLLSFAPSGAIVASPTTSLPEWPGAGLNWDYRYCWLRDASLTTHALLSIGFLEEAEAFVSWLLHSTRLTRPSLKILYDVYGRWPSEETELRHLSGYRGSKPVRIGNKAAGQLQLDVYGEVINSTYELLNGREKLDTEIKEMLNDFGRFVLSRWKEPDSGIWEHRGRTRHYTHSLLLCWTAFDRLLSFEKKGLLRLEKKEAYENARNAVKDVIENQAWSESRQSYVASLENPDIDASLLLMPWYGFLPYDCDRMKKTFSRIKRELSFQETYFYRNHDYEEGSFNVCALWAVDFLANGGGSYGDAESIFRRFLLHGNEVGLFAEEFDPKSRRQLGNFPLAFTHLGIINAALALANNRNKQERTKP
ncbi:MAG: glycoside hydrolase family 15 protein [Candidatus Omnitrophota bacterium]